MHCIKEIILTYQPSADNFVILLQEKRYREKRMMLWFYHFTYPSHKIAWWVNNHGFRHGRRNNICPIEGIIPLSLLMCRGASYVGVALLRAKSAARWKGSVTALDDGRRQLDGVNCLGELGGIRIEVQIAVRRTEYGLFYRGWKKVEESCGGYVDQLVSAHTHFVCCAKIKRSDQGEVFLNQIFQPR